MNDLGIIQLRIVPAVGAEQFAKYIYDKLTPWVESDSEGRVKIARVEFMEHAKNTAIYE
jgi:6-pyruvoyltetrahydropterin/6-carboxytetrahydropterin synthase